MYPFCVHIDVEVLDPVRAVLRGTGSMSTTSTIRVGLFVRHTFEPPSARLEGPSRQRSTIALKHSGRIASCQRDKRILPKSEVGEVVSSAGITFNPRYVQILGEFCW
jgi:hypothetical protein